MTVWLSKSLNLFKATSIFTKCVLIRTNKRNTYNMSKIKCSINWRYEYYSHAKESSKLCLDSSLQIKSPLAPPNPDHVTYSSYQSMVIISSPTGSGHRLQGVLQHELYPSQDQPFLAGFADSQQGWRSCLYITAKLPGHLGTPVQSCQL